MKSPLHFKQCDGIVSTTKSGSDLIFLSHNSKSFDTVEVKFSTAPRLQLKSVERFILFEEKRYLKLKISLKYSEHDDEVSWNVS